MPSRRAILRASGSAAATLTVAGCSSTFGNGPDAAQWRASVGGPTAMPGPAVAGGIVATVGTRGDGQDSGRVDAFDAASGERLWRRDLGRPTGLTTDGDAVYAGVKLSSQRGRILAFDVSSGEERWRQTVRNLASAMTVANGTLYTANGTLAALDVSDGTIRWELDRRGGAEFTIVVASDDQLAATNDRVLYGDQAGVYSLSPGDGGLQWQWRPEQWGSTEAGPYVAQDRLYVGTEFPNGAVALDADEGSKRWSHSFGADAHVLGFHAHGGGLVVATRTGFSPEDGFGTVYVLDDDGFEHQETRFDAPLTGVAGASDLAVTAGEDGTVTGLDANYVREERWRASFDEAPLVATDGERGFAQTDGGTLWALGGE